MTKDYAKRKRTKKKTNTRTTRSNSKKPISPIIVFLSGILLTLFAVFLWAIIKKPEVIKEIVEKKETEATAEKSRSETPKNTQKESQKEPATEFTYHEALTNKEVDVVITKPKTTDSDKTYIMQCGAFKRIDDAEKMKAELAFIGFQANILTKGGWHRVRLGPYKSKRTAESDRHKLQDNKYLNCQIW